MKEMFLTLGTNVGHAMNFFDNSDGLVSHGRYVSSG